MFGSQDFAALNLNAQAHATMVVMCARMHVKVSHWSLLLTLDVWPRNPKDLLKHICSDTKMQTFLTILSWAYMFASKEQRSRKLSWLAPGGKIFFIPRNDSCHYLEGVCVMLLLQKMNKVLYVVKYHDVELGHINRFMKRTSMDVTMLSTDEVTKAIRRSFAADERDPIPPREQCYLAESSFNTLQDLGLPIEEADFLNEDELRYGYKNSYFSCDWRFY
mmetsp:Transcript_19251/g.38695  ORF Transcript_19251/g.38695 Transcript_19251/m.38695 type:complete len:219 (+) Transcript_19251:136-792(+)